MLTKSALSPAFRRLMKAMQLTYFGRIEGLMIRDGEPVFDPRPTITREIKLARKLTANPLVELEDFSIKQEVENLLEVCRRIGNGEIRVIEVRNGLPDRVHLEDQAA